MYKKKILLIPFLLFLVAVSVQGAEFDVNIQNINSQIFHGETAVYNVTIYNFEDNSRVYTINLGAIQATSWIKSPNSVSVPALGERSFELRLRPTASVRTGSYQLPLSISTSGQPPVNRDLSVRVLADGEITGYVPNVAVSTQDLGAQDPRQTVEVRVDLNNRNQRVYPNLTLTVSSSLFEANQSFELGGLESTTRIFSFDIDPMTPSGDLDIRVTGYSNSLNRNIFSADQKISIGSYSVIDPSITEKTTFFKTNYDISLENEGNVVREKEVALKANLFQRMFLSSSHDYEVVEIADSKHVQWTVELQPGQEMVITTTKNYRPLAYLVILIVLLVIAYYLFRSPLILKKQAVFIQNDDEGVSDVKLRVFLKNRSKKTLYNISVTDLLPKITQYVPNDELGSLKPSKVTKKSSKGTILYWTIEMLEPLEERILTYNISSSLKIVGNLSLPRARAKFESAEGKESKTFSGNPTFESK